MAQSIGMIRSHHDVSDQEVHRSKWLIADGDTVIENGCVVTQKGRIVYAGPFDAKRSGRTIDHGPGVLMPCLVNAHTHLELSALKDTLSCQEGFKAWVQDLLVHRDRMGIDALIVGVGQGVRELLASGTGVVGDVSTLGIVKGPIKGLAGILFQEFLGNGMPDHLPKDVGGLISSFAGHAPHTSSPALLGILKKTCIEKNSPFSIHVAESEDEMEFITTGKGSWAEFLTQRGIDFSDWGLPCESPLTHLDRLGLLDPLTVCVHMIRATPNDITLLKDKGAAVCVCPRSNDRLHGMLPPVAAMVEKGLCLCLGTDSLASTPNVNLWDDMKFLVSRVPELSPREVFRMATENGAKALGLGHLFGRLAPKMAGTMIHVPVSDGSHRNLFDRLVS